MIKHHFRDVLVELIELSREVIQEINMQLTYYRASVYKHETAAVINEKIQQLKVVATIIAHDHLLEPFADFEATVINGNQKLGPDECFFSARAKVLVCALDNGLTTIELSLPAVVSVCQGHNVLERNVQKNKRQILSMCRQGTLHYDFFNQF